MNIFQKIFRQKVKNNSQKTKILAPISGKLINLDDVPDEIFSKKMIGDGIAINPTGSLIVAPCNGIISKIASSNHAFAMRSETGLEIFIHFGINTIKLNGYGITKIISNRQKVYTGEVLLTLDLEKIRLKAKSVITSIIISNSEMTKKIKKYSGYVKAGITKIMEITQ